MEGMTNVVKVLDDDASSVSSYFSGRRGRKHSIPVYHRSKPPSKEPLRVDGKVPDVIHSLEYISWHNNVLALRQSVNAFKHVPDPQFLDDDDAKPEHDGKDNSVERPVIEILTKVYSRRQLHRPPRPRARKSQTSRPVTSAFGNDNYHYDDYSSSDDQPELETVNFDVSNPVMIMSYHLKSALKAVVAYYPYFKMNDGNLTIPAPYRVLYHHRK